MKVLSPEVYRVHLPTVFSANSLMQGATGALADCLFLSTLRMLIQVCGALRRWVFYR